MSRSLSRWFRKLFDPATPAGLPARFRPCLEQLEGRWLPTAYTVNTTKDILHDTTPGEVTLRDALTAINTQGPSGNAAAGTASNTVSFAIGAVGSVQTINVGSGNAKATLPNITHQVFLDGWSQGGAGYSGPPLIVLNGAAAPSDAYGLNFENGSDGSTVRGLVIQQFLVGIALFFTNNDLIAGNYIGTDASGTVARGNQAEGITIDFYATGNTIGGTAPGMANVISGNGLGVAIQGVATKRNVVLGNFIGTDASGTAALGNGSGGVALGLRTTGNTVGGTVGGSANVISGNGYYGVEISGPATSGNLVLGNFIGTDKNGTAALANRWSGVLINYGATANTVGGTAPGAANVISANQEDGVLITNVGTTGNVVAGNRIGTDGSGTADLGNGGAGVAVVGGATGNSVGSPAPGAGNTIAFNAKGVVVADPITTAVRILGNSIFANAGPGIDLGDDGPTPNGANPRPFPNHGQNAPTLTAGTTRTISGTLSSSANTTFRLEFFAGTASRGTTYLGFLNVTTSPAGSASFTAPLSAPIGSVETATATNLTTGDTSELSASATVVDLDPPTSSVTAPPATVTTTYTVSWDGSDGPNGSGIASFQIGFADNGGPYTLFQEGAAGSATYTGQVGHTYDLYSIATDVAGNTQTTGSATLVTTYVAAFGDAFDGADSPALGANWSQVSGGMGVQNNHLAVTGTKPALAVYDGTVNPTDTAVLASVVALPGKGVSYGGLVGRYSSSGYYLGEVVGNGGTFTAYLFRNLGGTYTQLAGPARVSSGTGTLRLDAVGSSIKLFLNGQLLVYAFDATPSLARGATGVWGSPGTMLDDFAAGPVLADSVTLPFGDAFDGPGVAQIGRSWAELAGNFSVQGGRLRANAPGLNLATVNLAPAVADMAVQASIALGSSGVQFAGLAARYSGPGDGNMYLGEVVGRNGVFTAYIFRNVGGAWTQLSAVGLTSGTGLLLFTVKGSHLQLSFNGQVVGDVTDTTIAGPGVAGLRSGAGVLYSAFTASAP